MAAGDLITATQQVEWRGVLWGYPATSVGVTGLTGWLDLPPMRATRTDRAFRHGAYPGPARASARTIEVELTVVTPDAAALPALLAATTPTEDPAEEPLVIWAGTAAPQLVYARCERRAVPTDADWSVGHERATVQWVASDPRRYAVAEQSASVGLPTVSSGGLVFPTTYPLFYGTGTSGGLLSLVNAGSAATWPTFEITGPVTGPIVTNTSTGEQLLFDPTWTVNAGETVVIDTDVRTVTLAGVPRNDRLLTRQWFPLLPGTTGVRFSHVGVYDVAAGLTARWRPAEM